MTELETFVNDVFTLIPVVALSHASLCILRASRAGQLAEEYDDGNNDDGIIRRKDRKFNWLRHARDHVTVYDNHLTGSWLEQRKENIDRRLKAASREIGEAV